MTARTVIIGKLGTHPSAVYEVRGAVEPGHRVSVRSDQDRRVTTWTMAEVNEVRKMPAGVLVFMELA